jgi:hypothetical protein
VACGQIERIVEARRAVRAVVEVDQQSLAVHDGSLTGSLARTADEKRKCCAQCDISTGMVMERSIVRVAPPITSSRQRA